MSFLSVQELIFASLVDLKVNYKIMFLRDFQKEKFISIEARHRKINLKD